MPEMTGIKRRKYFEGMKIPHTYVIISCIVVLAFIATYLVPVGVYQRVLDPTSGRNIIDQQLLNMYKTLQ